MALILKHWNISYEKVHLLLFLLVTFLDCPRLKGKWVAKDRRVISPLSVLVSSSLIESLVRKFELLKYSFFFFTVHAASERRQMQKHTTLYDAICTMVKKRKYVIRSQEWLPLGHKKASGGLALFFFMIWVLKMQNGTITSENKWSVP